MSKRETAGRQYAVLRECESAVHGAGAAKPRHATPRRTHSRTASHATHNTSTNNVQASICCYREGHAVAIGKQQLVLSWWSYVVRAKESVPFRKAKKKGDCRSRAWTEQTSSLTQNKLASFRAGVSRPVSVETETEWSCQTKEWRK